MDQLRRAQNRYRPLWRRTLVLLTALGLAATSWSAAAAAAAPDHADRKQATHQPVATHPAQGVHRQIGPAIAGGVQESDTTVWAGYVATGATYTAVTARWTQPAITCDPTFSPGPAVVFWVGLDGFGDNSVEQGGTVAQCQGPGIPFYAVWWAMFPTTTVQFGFEISPGDSLQASVTYDPASQLFTIVVTDLTSNQTMSEPIACQPDQDGCPRLTAEVISEAPTAGGDIDGHVFLPNYGTLNYSDVSITDSTGHTGTFTDPAWTTTRVTEVSSQGVTMQTTSPLSTDGSSFSTVWQAESGRAPRLTNQYQAYSTSTPTTQINFAIRLTNADNLPATLSAYTIRYWFTEDGSQPMVFACDYAAIGCSHIRASIVPVSPPVAGADHYLELGFTDGTGTLPPGGDTGPIQVRVHQTNFAAMTQTNDYSFNAADTSFTANPAITVYRNSSRLVYGTEP
jgi:hypothetical protein